MKTTNDQWTPLFKSLKVKISTTGRTKLLGTMIDELYNISVLNFGDVGIARPSEFAQLKEKYAIEYKYGDQTPDLTMSYEMHALKNPDVQFQMIDSFRTTVAPNKATLMNISPYFNEHQFGKGKMYRPTIPVNKSGDALTPFAEESLVQIVDDHFKT